MSASVEEVQQLLAYIRASRELTSWITGAKVLALLSGAVDSGVLEALRAKPTVQQLVDVTGIDEKTIADLCLALEVHSAVHRDGERCELTPDFALLASPTAAIPLPDVIRYAMLMIRTLQTIAPFKIAYTTTPAEDILAMAAGSGISALSSSPHISQETVGKVMPELDALLQTGAWHLEVRCGVGNALFGTVVAYPNVTAVGIEIDELTAAETERRARLLGVADRVQVRRMDACKPQDEGTFDTIQWSQFFFPAASRAGVLEAMYRALKPGGYLLMPCLGSVSNDLSSSRFEKLRLALQALRSAGVSFLTYLNDIVEDTPGRRRRERRAAALYRLLFTQWGVPARSVAELASEVQSSGFTVIRAVHAPISQFVLTRALL